MEVLAGIIVFIILNISLSTTLTLIFIKPTGPTDLYGIMAIAGGIFILLLIIFALIDFSVVGQAVLPMVGF